MGRKANLILLAIIIACFVTRLYRFDNPIADWHSWRQSDTNAVSQRFVDEGIDLLHPKYYDISNIQSGLDNEEGYRMVEFPLYNLIQTSLFKAAPILTLVEWGRITTILFSLIGTICLYALVKKHIGQNQAFFAAAFYSFLPYSIYYGRTILPDTAMVATSLLAIYLFDKWLEKENWLYFFASIAATASALLLKPVAIFFAPILLYLAYKKYKAKLFLNWKIWMLALLSVVPLVLWRVWITNYPQGIPASLWLLNANNIRFTGAFFYWIFANRISALILGYFSVSLLILGHMRRKNDKGTLFSYAFLISSLLYVTVFAAGNVQHDYYQITIIPTLCIFLARGATLLLSYNKKENSVITPIILTVVMLFTFAFSYFQIRDYFNINNQSIVEAGNKANELLPKNAKVIAPYDGDTTFLNATKRKGWPAFQDSIEELINKGATHLVIANPTEQDFSGFGTQYKTVASTEQYLILQLE